LQKTFQSYFVAVDAVSTVVKGGMNGHAYHHRCFLRFSYIKQKISGQAEQTPALVPGFALLCDTAMQGYY